MKYSATILEFGNPRPFGLSTGPRRREHYLRYESMSASTGKSVLNARAPGRECLATSKRLSKERCLGIDFRR
jgi:hypothetical protein